MAVIVWEKEAEQALGSVPFFVRKLVRRKLEERIEKQGGSVITLRDFREAEAKFKSVSGEKSAQELEKMMPQDNTAKATMIAIDMCHAALSNCPNVLIDTVELKETIEKWLVEKDISERLRQRVASDTLLYHHKLRITIAGCPNGCSRPQIADIGLVGYVRPSVNPEECITCNACEVACPDTAITIDDAPPDFNFDLCQGCLRCRNACPVQCISLSKPGIRVLLGGKLGRHPHLAKVAGEMSDVNDVLSLLDKTINDYIENASLEERFAYYLIRRDGA